MTKGVPYIVESPKTHGDSGLSSKSRFPPFIDEIASAYPVMLGNFDRSTEIIAQHLVPPASPPTKYRRPPEGRRDSFGGGLLPAEGTPAHPMTRVLATSKAISRRYPLTGDCFDGGMASGKRLSW